MNRRDFIIQAVNTGAVMLGAPVLKELFIPLAEAKDLASFSFAHITDLHLDVRGTSTWQHREKSVALFIDSLRQVGRLQKLAFVVFGGDQVHSGPNDRESLVVFQEWTRHLDMPYYILLGNMEVSPVPGLSKLTRADFQAAWRARGLGNGRSHWAFDPVPGARVIGFDVTVDGGPHGEASPAALRWLEDELYASRDRSLVIVVTHHPLLPTSPRDLTPEWSIFLTRNHRDVRALLEKFPNVRLAISGHHHAARVETVNNITYVCDPAIVTYPCAFRVFTIVQNGIYLRSIGLDDRANVARARELLLADPYAALYDPDRPENVLSYSIGLTDRDREAHIPL